MAEFVRRSLAVILKDEELTSDVVDYVNSIEDVEDYKEFMGHLVDISDPKAKTIVDEIQLIKFGTGSIKSNKKTQQQPQQQNASKKSSTNNNASNSKTQPGNKQSSNKRKINLQQFLSSTEKPGMRKGRHPCTCQARIHGLVNNCIKCGRIVCEQEGSGPCFYCDELVVSKDEQEILAGNDKNSDILYNHLMEKKKSKEFKKAIERRNKLIAKDNISENITKIFDDELDYQKMDYSWVNPEEKKHLIEQQKALLEKRHESRLKKAFILNLATKSIEMMDDTFGALTLENLPQIQESSKFPTKYSNDDEEYAEHKINVEKILAKLKENNDSKIKRDIDVKKTKQMPDYRVLDKDYLIMKDYGLCLSMHQPWASLLVCGIKKHEGRTWYTPHRGRLWIAAASKKPDEEDIETCKQFYDALYPGKQLKFPEIYPTSCILGCVTVEDCLPQEAYREEYPDGESNSPYVFICSNPIMLQIAFPVQGQHKIFPLPSTIHRLATESLISLKKL